MLRIVEVGTWEVSQLGAVCTDWLSNIADRLIDFGPGGVSRQIVRQELKRPKLRTIPTLFKIISFTRWTRVFGPDSSFGDVESSEKNARGAAGGCLMNLSWGNFQPAGMLEAPSATEPSDGKFPSCSWIGILEKVAPR